MKAGCCCSTDLGGGRVVACTGEIIGDEWLAVVAVLMGGGGGECTRESVAMNGWLLVQC